MENAPSIHEQLEEWAVKAAKVYVELAQNNKLAFYQQSPLNKISKPVKVVVIGINPGSDGLYDNQKEEEGWNTDLIPVRDYILAGNKYWQEHENWAYWKNTIKLLSIAFDKDELNEPNVIFTNASFFGTKKANTLSHEIINLTLPTTISLIDILSPEIILCLSGNDCFVRLKARYKSDFESIEVFDKFFLIGRHKGKTLIGIYHPANFSKYFYEAKDLIQKAISIVRQNRLKELSQIKEVLIQHCAEEWVAVQNHKPTPKVVQSIAWDVVHQVAKHYAVTPRKSDVIIKVNDLVAVKVVVQSSKQYIYWRHINYNGKIQYTSPDASYPYTTDIRNMLLKYGYTPNKTALGEKAMKTFGYNHPKDMAEKIINEIEIISEELRKIIL